MTATDLPQLVTADSLAARLGVAAPDPTTQALIRGRWDAALLDASGTLRDVIGQPLSPATTTINLDLDSCGRALIPLCPVTAVTQVTDLASGNVIDPSLYTVRGQRLQVSPLGVTYPSSGCLSVGVTVAHGWDPIPEEIQRWVRVLAIAQIKAAERGNLGQTGGVTSVMIDDGKVTYADPVGIPERVQARLKAMYGGEAQ